MSKVDWSLAPEGATHYSDGNSSRSTYPAWWRPSQEASNMYECWAIGTSFGCETWQKGPFNLPRAAVKREWSGPEDGLPPINTLCEMHIDVDDIWIVGRVIAHAQLDDGHVAVAHNESEVFHGIAEDFRPIKTPEQIAQESRNNAIREIMDAAGIDCLVTATKLVDAGFKREAV